MFPPFICENVLSYCLFPFPPQVTKSSHEFLAIGTSNISEILALMSVLRNVSMVCIRTISSSSVSYSSPILVLSAAPESHVQLWAC